MTLHPHHDPTINPKDTMNISPLYCTEKMVDYEAKILALLTLQSEQIRKLTIAVEGCKNSALVDQINKLKKDQITTNAQKRCAVAERDRLREEVARLKVEVEDLRRLHQDWTSNSEDISNSFLNGLLDNEDIELLLL